MKYCSKCGAELLDEAVICPSCGCAQENITVGGGFNKSPYVIAMIFLIITVVSCLPFGLILLSENVIFASIFIAYSALCIAFAIVAGVHKKKEKPMSTGLKVCILLFGNFISGIALLCAKEK